MRSKAVEGNKRLLLNMFKLEGFASLFRGVTAVVYGYALSSLIYFYAYAQLRDSFYEKFREHNQNKIVEHFKQKRREREEANSAEKESELLHNQLQESFNLSSEVTFGQQLAACFVASSLGELLALPVYYPFDLMKTRM